MCDQCICDLSHSNLPLTSMTWCSFLLPLSSPWPGLTLIITPNKTEGPRVRGERRKRVERQRSFIKEQELNSALQRSPEADPSLDLGPLESTGSSSSPPATISSSSSLPLQSSLSLRSEKHAPPPSSPSPSSHSDLGSSGESCVLLHCFCREVYLPCIFFHILTHFWCRDWGQIPCFSMFCHFPTFPTSPSSSSSPQRPSPPSTVWRVKTRTIYLKLSHFWFLCYLT